MPKTGLRTRKKQRTRRDLQEKALSLFLRDGYEATTVDAIAAAADVSAMTFYRYFPTKEHVILEDDYDPMLAGLIAARPPDEPIVDRVRHAIRQGLGQIYTADREQLLARTRLIVQTPALRARLWEQQAGTEELIVRALGHHHGSERDRFRVRVTVAACLAALVTALKEWVERPDETELPELIDSALAVLSQEPH